MIDKYLALIPLIRSSESDETVLNIAHLSGLPVNETFGDDWEEIGPAHPKASSVAQHLFFISGERRRGYTRSSRRQKLMKILNTED